MVIAQETQNTLIKIFLAHGFESKAILITVLNRNEKRSNGVDRYLEHSEPLKLESYIRKCARECPNSPGIRSSCLRRSVKNKSGIQRSAETRIRRDLVVLIPKDMLQKQSL